MSIQRITFATVPARAVSQAQNRGRGEVLEYSLIVAVRVGNGPVTRFRHPEYDQQVASEAQPSPRSYDVPSVIAERIKIFAEQCFVKPGVRYDGNDFIGFWTRRQKSPTGRRSGGLAGLLEVSTVRPNEPIVICDRSGQPIHPFYCLGQRTALSVNGLRGTFGISSVRDLMRVYGGTRLGHEYS